MPNRLIRESICTSDNLNALSKDAEILFYRLIVNCDDYGLLDARPAIVLSKCFPLKIKSINEKDIDDWLQELADNELIFLYLVKDKRYLKMTSWGKHQQIRSQKSKYPQPDNNGYQMISDEIKCTRNPIQSESNPNPNPNPNMCVDDTTAEKSDDDGAQDNDPGKGDKYTQEFESFWLIYPRRKEKRKAFKAWSARTKENVYPEDMITAATNYSLYCKNQRTEERFIKHPSTFLGPDKPYEEYVNYVPVVGGMPKNVSKALELLQKAEAEEAQGHKEVSVF